MEHGERYKYCKLGGAEPCSAPENAEAVEQLCAHCPIPGELAARRATMNEEIVFFRQTDTKANFQNYCENGLKESAKSLRNLQKLAFLKNVETPGNEFLTKLSYEALIRLFRVELKLDSPSEHGLPTAPNRIVEPEPTIKNLCIHPFTESDVVSLLLHLGVIVEVVSGAEASFQVVSKTLKGKAKGVISAFPAALGVLSNAKLFSGDKRKWSVATASAYGQPLGRRVLGYEKNSLKGDKPGSGAFDKHTRKAEDWLFSWQERLKQTPNGHY